MSNDDYIKNYVINGGVLFFIDGVNSIRDGGTLILTTTVKDKCFYIHKDDWTFHAGYPATDENIINDYPTKVYLTDRLEKYRSNCEFELGRANRILNMLNDRDILKND